MSDLKTNQLTKCETVLVNILVDLVKNELDKAETIKMIHDYFEIYNTGE